MHGIGAVAASAHAALPHARACHVPQRWRTTCPPSLQFDSLNGIECAIDVDWYLWGSLLQAGEDYYDAGENLQNVIRLYDGCGVATSRTWRDYATYNGSAPQSCTGIDLTALEIADLLSEGCAAASNTTCPGECAQTLAQVCQAGRQAGRHQLHESHKHVSLPLPLPLQLNNNFQCVYEVASLTSYCLTSYANSDAGEIECGFYGFGLDLLTQAYADDGEMTPDWIKPTV
jgi:hypothetical protein